MLILWTYMLHIIIICRIYFVKCPKCFIVLGWTKKLHNTTNTDSVFSPLLLCTWNMFLNNYFFCKTLLQSPADKTSPTHGTIIESPAIFAITLWPRLTKDCSFKKWFWETFLSHIILWRQKKTQKKMYYLLTTNPGSEISKIVWRHVQTCCRPQCCRESMK